MDLIPSSSSSSSSSPQKAAQKQEGRNGGQMLDGAEGKPLGPGKHAFFSPAGENFRGQSCQVWSRKKVSIQMNKTVVLIIFKDESCDTSGLKGA